MLYVQCSVHNSPPSSNVLGIFGEGGELMNDAADNAVVNTADDARITQPLTQWMAQ